MEKQNQDYVVEPLVTEDSLGLSDNMREFYFRVPVTDELIDTVRSFLGVDTVHLSGRYGMEVWVAKMFVVEEVVQSLLKMLKSRPLL